MTPRHREGDIPTSKTQQKKGLAPKPKPVQCAAKSKQTGKRCGSYCAPGFTVCQWHGAKTPRAIAAARARLNAEVMPSIAVLADERDSIMNASADRIRAAVAILDRAGYGPKMSVEVEDARELLIEKLREIRARGPEAIERLNATGINEIIDAEIVD